MGSIPFRVFFWTTLYRANSHIIRGYIICSFPHHSTLHPPPPPPPPSRLLVYHWQLQKHPLSRGFSGKSSRDYTPTIPPFQRKWEHACGPPHHAFEWGGGGGGSKIQYRGHITSIQVFATLYKFLCVSVHNDW